MYAYSLKYNTARINIYQYMFIMHILPFIDCPEFWAIYGDLGSLWMTFRTV